jgi:hypothetical protein
VVIIYLFLFIYLLFSVNIKPPRHRFGFSLAWDWQSRARANLSIAMSDYAWSQQARAIPKLVSAMRHMDSFELFKVTRDPRVLFSPKGRGRSVAGHQASQGSEQQVVDPFCWGSGEHVPTNFVVLSYCTRDLKGMFNNSAVNVRSVEAQVTSTISAQPRARRRPKSQPVVYVRLTLITQESSKNPSYISYPTMVMSGLTAVPYLRRSRRRRKPTS